MNFPSEKYANFRLHEVLLPIDDPKLQQQATVMKLTTVAKALSEITLFKSLLPKQVFAAFLSRHIVFPQILLPAAPTLSPMFFTA